jgi:hypothetical protein
MNHHRNNIPKNNPVNSLSPDLIPSMGMIHWNLVGSCNAKYNTRLIIPITKNPNKLHHIANPIGDTFDHFLIVRVGIGCRGIGGIAGRG